MEAFNSLTLTSNDGSLQINDNSKTLIQGAIHDMRKLEARIVDQFHGVYQF
jgi:hypothetical protein